MMRSLSHFVLTAVGAALLAGCATDRPAGANTSRAQFVDSVEVTKAGAARVQNKAPSTTYSEVLVTAVSSPRLRQMSWWDLQNPQTKEQLKADCARVAAYMKSSFEKAIAAYPGNRFRVVQKASPKTLRLDLSLVELNPAKVFWNTAASAAGFVIPGAGLATVFGNGSIGLEGQMRDGRKGEVLVRFKHRETDKFALINVGQYTWYHGSEGNIDDLARKMAEWLNAPAGTVVNRSSRIKMTSF